MDNTKFDAILYVAAKRAGQPELDMYYNPQNSYEPSIRFVRKMRRFIKRILWREAWDEWKSVTTPLKRIVVAAMLVCTISLGCVLSIKAVRDAIWSTIIEWYDKYIEVVFVTDDDVEVPTEILEYKEPRAGLEGYERYEIVKNAHAFIVEYEKENSMIAYRQLLLGDSSISISNNDTQIQEVIVNGNSALYSEYTSYNETMVGITWNDDDYQYSLEGNIPSNEMIKIAESVK